MSVARAPKYCVRIDLSNFDSDLSCIIVEVASSMCFVF